MSRFAWASTAACLLTALSALSAYQAGSPQASESTEQTVASEAPATPATSGPPLTGVRVVVDPGHQLGNHSFPSEVKAPVPAGGFTKPCNTTGAATDLGYPEATFNFRVARLTERRLERLGAKVRLTRRTNSEDRWGPCVDERGRAGNRFGADLMLSLHADGHVGGTGFHVITPPDRRPWTHDIAKPSRRLAVDVRDALTASGLSVSTYAGEHGIDVRDDLATLNLSDVPTVIVELGNLRDPAEAEPMATRRGQQRYARAVAAGVRTWLTRRPTTTQEAR